MKIKLIKDITLSFESGQCNVFFCLVTLKIVQKLLLVCSFLFCKIFLEYKHFSDLRVYIYRTWLMGIKKKII